MSCGSRQSPTSSSPIPGSFKSYRSIGPRRQGWPEELAARMTIEHAPGSVGWKSFLDAVRKDGHHDSWRRAALLALVRSEIGNESLKRASAHLFDNKAEVLRELVRLVMAVDVEPGTKRVFRDWGRSKINPRRPQCSERTILEPSGKPKRTRWTLVGRQGRLDAGARICPPMPMA
jgi:hypothetical protein